jgi:hypothetical protein
MRADGDLLKRMRADWDLLKKGMRADWDLLKRDES